MAKRAPKPREQYEISKFILSSSDISNLSACGIYKIHHVKDPSKMYIGCTSHKANKSSFLGGFYTRWASHVRQLLKGNHSSKLLQSFVNENGIDGIRFSIVEICEDKILAFIKEKEYITKFNAFYNAVSAVYQFDMNGIFIKKHFNASDAARNLGIDRASINNTCLGNRSSAGGFLWSFENSIKAPIIHFIEQMDMNGNTIRFHKSYGDAAKAMGSCSSNSIRSFMKGNQSHAYGFTWKETVMSAEERRERGLLITKNDTV